MTTALRTKAGEFGRWLPGVALSLVAILFLARLADWSEVARALAAVEITWLVPAIFCYLAGVFFRSLTWKTLLLDRASLSQAFLKLNEGYLINNLFPLRLGELGRVLLLSQDTGLSAFFVLSTTVIERAYDLAIAALLLLATLPLVLSVGSTQAVAFGVAGAVGIGMTLMFLLARSREQIQARLTRMGVSHTFYQRRILPWLDSFIAGLEVLTRTDRFLLSLGLILLSWVSGAIEIHLLILSFGAPAPFWWTGFALGVVSLGIAVPSAPASLGVYEAAMVGALTVLGVPASQALAIAILAHVIHIASTGLIGGIALFRDGRTLTGVYRRVRSVRLSREP